MQSIRVTVQGFELHALEYGEGPAVVLLHGFGNSSEDWRPTVELLGRSGYRAIAVDALGFGLSDKPADAPYSLTLYASLYQGLVAALGLERATFIAHSFGGKIAMATAVLYPERVEQLVLVDSEGFVPIPLLMRKGGTIPFLGEMMLWMSARPQVLQAQLGAFFYEPKTYVTAELVNRAVATLQDPAQRQALLKLSRCYDDHDLVRSGIRARLGELRCPTLILWGEEDRVFSLASGQAAQREIAGAQLVAFPRCGHFPQVEAFRGFHGVVLGFLAHGGKEREDQ
ncbi:MAG: alpha/beta fold hydrolase [Chloroflexaceae bacterium]|nr:alpha/beta fold hydrolase [Chloroflexaceae bacterium]